MAEQQKDDRAQVTLRVEKLIEKYADDVKKGVDTMTLGSGVKVKLLRLPPLLVQQLEDQFTDPRPPVVEVKVQGKKELQPNPDDPDYLKALEDVRTAKGWAYFDLVMLKGMQVKMPVDDEWLEELRLIGIEIGESKAAKKLAYIKFVLIQDVAELEEVVGRVLALSGVTPQAVDEAAKTVPD